MDQKLKDPWILCEKSQDLEESYYMRGELEDLKRVASHQSLTGTLGISSNIQGVRREASQRFQVRL